MKKLILFLLLSLLTTSCGSLISNMHRDFDNADGKRPTLTRSDDQFDFYRKNRLETPRRELSSKQQKTVLPSIKRDYKPSKRVKADDLTDNGNSGSLWVGNDNQNNFLFTDESKKSSGDIVLIDVESSLKNQISAELNRAFPAKVTPSASSEKTKDSSATANTSTTPASPKTNEEKSEDKVFDRISSIIIEEINNDHLLLRGRKYLLFKNRKRLVEIQALVPRRDVTNADTISSSNIIESSINIVR